MRNLTVFILLVIVLLTAVIIGRNQAPNVERENDPASVDAVPHIGRVQILNGCGLDGIGWRAADKLRRCGFDVKSDGIGNAETFNYSNTLVVSRIRDMSVANRIGKALDLESDKVLLIRTPEQRFDATVILGADIEGKLK